MQPQFHDVYKESHTLNITADCEKTYVHLANAFESGRVRIFLIIDGDSSPQSLLEVASLAERYNCIHVLYIYSRRLNKYKTAPWLSHYKAHGFTTVAFGVSFAWLVSRIAFCILPYYPEVRTALTGRNTFNGFIQTLMMKENLIVRRIPNILNAGAYLKIHFAYLLDANINVTLQKLGIYGDILFNTEMPRMTILQYVNHVTHILTSGGGHEFGGLIDLKRVWGPIPVDYAKVLAMEKWFEVDTDYQNVVIDDLVIHAFTDGRQFTEQQFSEIDSNVLRTLFQLSGWLCRCNLFCEIEELDKHKFEKWLSGEIEDIKCFEAVSRWIKCDKR
jgi:hypothetical protein